jgi:uncharacterized glyoxalase superfamily protein PhnB
VTQHEAGIERDLSRFEGEGGPSAPSGLSSPQPGTERARTFGTAKLLASVPILRVRNARLSTRYYLEVLGFRKDWEDPQEPVGPLLVSVSRDGVTFYLSERRDDGTLGCRANVLVDDARALFEELQHHGARMMSALDVQTDGSVEFVVSDLDGNVIRFDQIARTGSPPKPSGRSPRGGSRRRAPRRPTRS